MNKIMIDFQPKYIKKHIKWLQRISLAFSPTRVSIDVGSKDGDYTAEVKYKVIEGELYIMEVKYK